MAMRDGFVLEITKVGKLRREWNNTTTYYGAVILRMAYIATKHRIKCRRLWE
jgi:hypothetical protein